MATIAIAQSSTDALGVGPGGIKVRVNPRRINLGPEDSVSIRCWAKGGTSIADMPFISFSVSGLLFFCALFVFIIFRRNATHCISPYAIVMCLCVCVCVCMCVCVCRVCGSQENGLR